VLGQKGDGTTTTPEKSLPTTVLTKKELIQSKKVGLTGRAASASPANFALAS